MSAPDVPEWEYRVCFKSGAPVHAGSDQPPITDLEVARAGALWEGARNPRLAPYVVQRRRFVPHEWENLATPEPSVAPSLLSRQE